MGPLRAVLKFDVFRPPRPAVAALMALAQPTNGNDVYTSLAWSKANHQGAVTWHLAAITSTGLAMVTATADSKWDQNTRDEDLPPNAIVDARWRPWRALVAITASHSWKLHFDDRAEVTLTSDSEENSAERLASFIDRLKSLDHGSTLVTEPQS